MVAPFRAGRPFSWTRTIPSKDMRCEAGPYFFAEQTGPPSPIRARKPPLDARFASCPGMPAEPDGIPGLLCNRFPFPCLRLYTIGFRRIPTCVSGPFRQWCEAIGMSTGTPHGSMQPGPAVVWSGDCGPGFAVHACLKPPFPLQGGSADPGGGVGSMQSTRYCYPALYIGRDREQGVNVP